MKHLFFFACAASLMSCATQRMATTGTVEHDEVYYRPGDTYITELNLSSNVLPGQSSEDEYITEDAIANQQQLNNPMQPFGSGSSWLNSMSMGYGMYGGYSPFGSGWNNYGMGGFQPFYNYGVGMGYSPFGMGGYSPYYSSMWNGGYGSPYGWGYGSGWNAYNPYYGYGYGYNPYYGGYSNYWGGNGFGLNNDAHSGAIFGPRNPIGAVTSNNSSYSNNVFYSGDKRETAVYAPVLIQNETSGGNISSDQPMSRPELKPSVGSTFQDGPSRELPQQNNGNWGQTGTGRANNGTTIDNRTTNDPGRIQQDQGQTGNTKPERVNQDSGRTVNPSRTESTPSRNQPTPNRDVTPSRGGNGNGGGGHGGGGGGGRKK